MAKKPIDNVQWGSHRNTGLIIGANTQQAAAYQNTTSIHTHTHRGGERAIHTHTLAQHVPQRENVMLIAFASDIFPVFQFFCPFLSAFRSLFAAAAYSLLLLLLLLFFV